MSAKKDKHSEGLAKIRILILAANPKSTPRLRLDEEVREIEEGLQLAKHRERFDLRSAWAMRDKDIRRSCLNFEPHIVHFTGFGNEEGIYIEDEAGFPAQISPDALSGLFALLVEHVFCVIIGAGYSMEQAQSINRHIPYVIGIDGQLKDAERIGFALGFYDALGAGRSIDSAFDFGKNAIIMKRTGQETSSFPVLHKSEGLFTDFVTALEKESFPPVPVFDWERLGNDMKALSKKAIFGNDTHTLENIFVYQNGEFKPERENKWTDTGDLGEFLGSFDFQNLKEKQLPLVLYGDFGIGKSSLLKMLCKRIPEDSPDYVPIFVPLRDLALYGVEKLTDALIAYLDVYGNLDLKCLDRKVLFLFDGFDELNFFNNEKDWIQKRFNQLTSLLRYPKVHMIISTRPVLFLKQESNLPPNTPIIKIRPFSHEKIKEWLGNWERCRLGGDSNISFRELEERELLHIVDIPLLLYMTARIFDDELQEKRSYSKGYIYKLFYDWTIRGKFKGEQKVHRLPENYREILQNIAVTIFNFGNGKEYIEYNRLQTYIREQQKDSLDNSFVENIESTLLVAHFFKSGRVKSSDIKYIEFTHKSFREYLIAEKFFDFFRKSYAEGEIELAKWYGLGRILPKVETVSFLRDLVFNLPDAEIRWLWKQLSSLIYVISIPTDFDIILQTIGEKEVKSFNTILMKSANLSVWAFILNNIIFYHFREKLELPKWENNVAFLTYIHYISCSFTLLTQSGTSYPGNWPVVRAFLNEFDISGAALSSIDLNGTNLMEIDLDKLDCCRVDFHTANFSNTKLTDGKFSLCDLKKIVSRKTSFIRCSFHEVTFENAHFEHTLFKEVSFRNVNFSKTVLNSCTFENCTFENTDLTPAIITDCNGIESMISYHQPECTEKD